MSTHDALKQEVTEFLAMTGIKKTTLGRDACNDTSFVQRLFEGRDIKVSTLDEIRAYMAGKRAEAAARRCG